MNLFKKKEEKKEMPACACNGSVPEMEASEIKCNCNCGCGCGCTDKNTLQSIKVLGSGCKSCHNLYENVKEALKNMNIDVDVEYVTDMEKIMEYSVMSTPALIVNEEIAAMGKVLKPKDVEDLLRKLGF